jgi:hypothetical protein
VSGQENVGESRTEHFQDAVTRASTPGVDDDYDLNDQQFGGWTALGKHGLAYEKDQFRLQATSPSQFSLQRYDRTVYPGQRRKGSVTHLGYVGSPDEANEFLAKKSAASGGGNAWSPSRTVGFGDMDEEHGAKGPRYGSDEND